MLKLRLLVALPFVVIGCLGNDNALPPIGTTPIADAGGVDATVLDSAVPDSGTPDSPAIVDSAIDAPIDAGPKPVTVNVLKRGVPISGVTIVFGDASGAILATATTDAAGSASQFVSAGSQVTAVFGTIEAPQFVTVLGVKPGDVLVANDGSSDLGLPNLVSIDSIPANPPAETGQYTVNAGMCGIPFGAPPAQLYLAPECENSGKFPLLIVASDTNATPLGYTFMKDVSLTPDGGVPDSGVLSVAATGTWSTTTLTQTLTASHTPVPDGGSIFASLAFSEVAGGVAFGTSQAFNGADLDGGVQSDDFQAHPGYPDFVQGEGTLRTDRANGVAYQAIARRRPTPTATAIDAFDFAQVLPELLTATVDSTAPARPVAAWTSTGSLAAADGVVLQMRWSVPQFNGTGLWTIVAPPDATTVKAPEMPASLSGWLPATDTVASTPTIAIVEATFITGYDQLRANASSFAPSNRLVGDYSSPVVPPLPIDGTLRLTGFTAAAE